MRHFPIPALLALLLLLPLWCTAQDSSTYRFKKSAGELVTYYNTRQFEKIRDLFSGTAKMILTQKRIDQLFGDLHNERGSIVRTGEPQMENTTRLTMFLAFEKDTPGLDLILPFNSDGKLIGLQLLPANRIRYPKLTDSTTIEDIVKPYLNRTQNAGLTIGIYAHDAVYFYHFGETEKGSHLRPDSNTIYEIGSLTKVFTTILLADLVRKKQVRYNDPLSKFLPDSIPQLLFKNREITLLDLATHTSGLPRMPANIEATITDSLNPYEHYTRRDLYACLQDLKLQRPPGSVYEYSNLGMALLGDILAQQLNMTYEAAVHQEILSRLKMINTGIKLSEKQYQKMAKGYNEEGKLTPYWDFVSTEGAGALRADAADMVRFMVVNLGHGEKDLVAIMNDAQARRTSETALGWHLMNLRNRKILWHNGGTFGFSSFMGLNRTGNTGVVVLSNCATGVDEIGMLVLEKLLAHPKTKYH